MGLSRRLTSLLAVEQELEAQLGVNIEQVFTDANTDYTLRHGLRRTPRGWACIDSNTFGVFKRVSWDKTEIVMQCDTAATTAIIRVW
jgi:hypothetical protein